MTLLYALNIVLWLAVLLVALVIRSRYTLAPRVAREHPWLVGNGSRKR